ncbi:hypothetical protein B9Z55_012873 [Caenorhabditis nigoni]|uniref:Uncharacterized protein n=1 Tax=Caenorhabditis nigoni TaxID=1611254 RepID=A0A2G5TZ90_9PELO|nr:hypothetical protein B9Z55_012873 [Caenorhabditis nigoni]
MDNAEPNPAPLRVQINVANIVDQIVRIVEDAVAQHPREELQQIMANITNEIDRRRVEVVPIGEPRIDERDDEDSSDDEDDEGDRPAPIPEPQMRENMFDEFYVDTLKKVIIDLEYVHFLCRHQPADHRARGSQFLAQARMKFRFIQDVMRMCAEYHRNVRRVLDGEEGRQRQYYEVMICMNDIHEEGIRHAERAPDLQRFEIVDGLIDHIRNELGNREEEDDMAPDEKRRRRMDRYLQELNAVQAHIHQQREEARAEAEQEEERNNRRNQAQLRVMLSHQRIFDEAYEEKMRLFIKDLEPVRTSLRRRPQDRQLVLEHNLAYAKLRLRCAGAYAEFCLAKLVGRHAHIHGSFAQYYEGMTRTIAQKRQCILQMSEDQRDEELLVLVERQINATKNELNARRRERNLSADEQRRRRIERYGLGWNREENWVLEMDDGEPVRQEDQQEVPPNRRRPHPDLDQMEEHFHQNLCFFERKIEETFPVVEAPDADYLLDQALQDQRHELARILGNEVALPAGEQDAEDGDEGGDDEEEEDQADDDDDDEEAAMVHFQGTARRSPESARIYLPPNKNNVWIYWDAYDVMEWARQFLPEVVDYLVPLEMDGRYLYIFVNDPTEWSFEKMPLGYYLKLLSNLNRVINDYNNHPVQD